MRNGWLILAMVLAVPAGCIVWSWPRIPLCRLPESAGVPYTFGSDSRLLITVADHDVKSFVHQDPEIHRWEARTGKLLGRTELPRCDTFQRAHLQISRDGRQALLGQPIFVPAFGGESPPEWYLYDAASGRRTAGPFPITVSIPYGSFSPDGKWFISFQTEGRSVYTGIHVHSAQTGEIVSTTVIPDRRARRECFFSPDSKSVAIYWLPETTTPGLVQVTELPSGREIRRFASPSPYFEEIRQWDGSRLLVAESTPDYENGHITVKGWILDADDLGEIHGTHDPLLWSRLPLDFPASANGWGVGSNWIARFSPHYESNTDQLINKCIAWIQQRMDGKPRVPRVADISITDRQTGKVRFTMPLPSCFACISDDGDYMACWSTDRQLEVWDTNPPSRLPVTIGAGAVVGGLVLALGRCQTLRQRRKGKVA